MKMTPEQKAFYEYGQAVELLRESIYKIRKNAIHEFGEPYFLLMQHEKMCLINSVCLPSKIHYVRQKRAECRLWVPLERRECRTCRYLGYNCPHADCIQGIYLEDFCYWEPRKEGES